MADTGWLYPSTGSSGSPGDVSWTSASNITAADGSEATVNLEGNPEEYSYRLQSTGYSPSLPAGATVTGVEMRVTGHRHNTSGDKGSFLWNEVYLMIGGSVTGNNKSSGSDMTTTPGANTDFGGDGDMWGVSAAADFSTIGASIKFYNDDGQYDCRGDVDSIALRIYYTASAATQAKETIQYP